MYKLTTKVGILKPTEIQNLGDGLLRVGTIGDGKCLIHSILFATDADYRAADEELRGDMASVFHAQMKADISRLLTISYQVNSNCQQNYTAAAIASLGEMLVGANEVDIPELLTGAGFPLAEEFNDLFTDNELSVEMGSIITAYLARPCNFLAIEPGFILSTPNIATIRAFRMDLPTVVVMYMQNKSKAGRGYGHYESIIEGSLAEKVLTPSALVFGSGSGLLQRLMYCESEFERMRRLNREVSGKSRSLHASASPSRSGRRTRRKSYSPESRSRSRRQ